CSRVNFVLAIPLGVRLALLFVLGAFAGGLINLAVYRLAWRQRSISPWSAPAQGAPARRWRDRLPVLGWLGITRQSTWYGRGFWIRPMLLEIATGVLFAVYYWWTIH